MYGWQLGPLDVAVNTHGQAWFPLGCGERPARQGQRLQVDLLPFDAPPSDEDYAQFMTWTDSGCRIVARRTAVDIDWPSMTAVWHWPVPESPYDQLDLRSSTALATMLALALRRGGILLHGATLRRANEAVVVCGQSGAGKSTLARRFHGRYLHDDTSLLMPGDDGWQVWFQNIHRAGPGDHPFVAPLRRIFTLGPDRSSTAKEPLPLTWSVQRLLEQTYYATPWVTHRMTEHLVNLLGSVPSYSLSHCLDTPLPLLERVLWE